MKKSKKKLKKKTVKRTKTTPKPMPMAKIKFQLNVKQAPKPPKLPMIHHKHIKQIKISLSNMHNKARARLKLAEHEVEDAVTTLHDAIKKFKSIKF